MTAKFDLNNPINQQYASTPVSPSLTSSIACMDMALKVHNGTGELIWQIRCRGVVSVWGTTGDFKSTAIHKVYTSIMHKSKQFKGVKFQRHSWVDVPVPFDLEVFSRRLLLNFHSEDLQVEEIAAVAMMGDLSLTQECCKLMRDEDCFVVINGLQSTHDWDLIKEAFLSKSFRGCIVVITNEQSVATHCVDDEDGALNINDLKDDPVLCSMMKSCQYYGTQDKEASRRGRLFSIRREEAREWFKKFGEVFNNLKLLTHRVTSMWGTCAWKSDIVRNIYYEKIRACEQSMEQVREVELQAFHKMEEFTMFSWVNVEHPLNLTNFSWRLILDFHSDDLQAKRTVAFGIMEGQDLIQECCKFLCEYKCLVVIDGLCTTHEWDLIKAAFLSEPTKGCIIVITNEASVAKYIVSEEHEAFNVEDLAGEKVVHPFKLIKGCASHLLSNRSEEAREWTNTFTLVGRQTQAAEDLANRIGNHGVTAVWGIAGVGKSALVTSVYCHTMLGLWQFFRNSDGPSMCYSLHRQGFKMFGWVDVPHPFNLTDFSRRLLLDFLSDDIHAKEAAAVGIVEGHDPIQGCRRIMNEQKCLIVVDGLRSKDDWDLIKAAFLPYSTTKAYMVVITNEESVANHCVDHKRQVVNVKGLEADLALNLFKKITWGGKEMTPYETELSKHIISKCGGILKIIAAIAKEITDFGDISWAATYTLDGLNVDFIGTLEREPRYHSLRGLFAWMQSYFEACSDSLKPCIFYMSVFPAKQNIRRRRLLRRWIAEGYSRDTFGRVTEENGESLFSELVDLSVIQQEESKVLCQVNGFFHEYIISRPREDNLVFALEGHCNLNSQHAGQHLTIRSTWDRDAIVFKGIDLADASGVTNDDLDQIGKLLPQLKFLCLCGCKEISRLPESLSGLSQLQTLDVRHTSIVTLPLAIIKLHKLQYIRAGINLLSNEGNDTVVNQTASSSQEDIHDTSMIPAAASNVRTSTASGSCGPRSLASAWLSKFQRSKLNNGGVKVPLRIGKLTSLHTLGVVNVNVAGGKTILKGLKNLTQLRKLGVSGINRGNWHDLCFAISGHAHLESLSVQLDKDKEGLFARFSDIFSPPQTLKSIKFHGHVLILPIWVKPLANLKKGNLEMTIFTQEDADALRELPFYDGFRCLCVKPIQDGVLQVGKQDLSGNFLCYRVLEIDCTSRLHVSFGYYGVGFVEVLMVHCSHGSSLRVSGLQNLRRLKEVWLKGSYDDELEQDLRQQISSHVRIRLS